MATATLLITLYLAAAGAIEQAPAPAPDPEGSTSASAAPDDSTKESQPREWPSWLTLGFEYRGRLELPSALNFDEEVNDQFYLNRIRASAGVEPKDWLRFYVQIQDARAFGFSDAGAMGSVTHHFDFREAYAEFGRAKGTWILRAGRQELAFGDERLLGADSYWDPLGQTFDAVRLTYQRRGVRLDAFGAFVVAPGMDHLAVPSTANRIYGLYSSFDKGPKGSVVEPYFFWKSNRRTADGLEANAECDVYTYGVRAAGGLPARMDYNIEMARQGGHRAVEPIQAWAGHWELGVRPFGGDFGPRLAAEYNFATGDDGPHDGHHTTFDDLYPAGYNKYGMADPFAWRNLRNISGGADWSLGKRWRVGAGYRTFWLATIQDGLYTDGDAILTRNPRASSDHVGDQVSLLAAWEFSKSWQFYAGYARFFPGSFLTDSSYHGRYSTPYVMLNYKFD